MSMAVIAIFVLHYTYIWSSQGHYNVIKYESYLVATEK